MRMQCGANKNQSARIPWLNTCLNHFTAYFLIFKFHGY